MMNGPFLPFFAFARDHHRGIMPLGELLYTIPLNAYRYISYLYPTLTSRNIHVAPHNFHPHSFSHRINHQQHFQFLYEN